MPAGHFVAVNLGGAELGTRIEGLVVLADGFPVDGEVVKKFLVKLGVALIPAHGVDDGIKVGLCGKPREGRDREVDHIDASLGSFNDRGASDAAGVVGVEMYRDADLITERFDQLVSSVRIAEA